MQLDSFAFFIAALVDTLNVVWPWTLGLGVVGILFVFFGKRKQVKEEKTKSDGL